MSTATINTLKVGRQAFLKAFALAASIVPTRSPKEILQNVRLDVDGGSAGFISTDMELVTNVPVQVESEGKFSVLLHAQRFGLILREMNCDDIVLTVDDVSVSIEGNGSSFTLGTAKVEEFPAVKIDDHKDGLIVSAEELKAAIKRTVNIAQEQDGGRFALNSICLNVESEGLVSVTTDGRRLSINTSPVLEVRGDLFECALLPPKAALAVSAMCDNAESIFISADASNASFRSGDLAIRTQLVEGRFPSWKNVVPKEDPTTELKIDTKLLQSSIRQALITSDVESRAVNIILAGSEIVVRCATAEIGESTISHPCEYKGDDCDVIVNGHYILDYLRGAEGEVTVYFRGPVGPLYLVNGQYRCVIMPQAKQ